MAIEAASLSSLIRALDGQMGRVGDCPSGHPGSDLPSHTDQPVALIGSQQADVPGCHAWLAKGARECPQGWLSLALQQEGWQFCYQPAWAIAQPALADWLMAVGDVRAWLPADAQPQRQAIERLLEARVPADNQTNLAETMARQRRQKQLENWLTNIETEFRGLVGSWRWKVGHRIISLVERLLLRKPVPLASDRIFNILRAFHASRRDAFLLDMQSRQSNQWQTARSQPGAPVSDYIPVLQRETVFAQELARIIGLDAEQGELLRLQLDQADAELADHLRDLGATQAPLVSIIMPSWQRAELIEAAVASVREQRYQHWELLVCDDGSSDDTEQRIAALNDPRIRFLSLPHRGAAAARNSGLAESRGEIITYLDTDNLWHPEYLGRIVLAYMQQPGTMAIACQYLDVELLNEGIRLRDRRIDYSYAALAQENFIDLNSFSHRRSLYDCYGGFTEALPRRQDWDFVLKLLFRFDPLIIEQPMCLYRRNSAWGQITQTAAEQTEAATDIIRANLQRYYQQGCLKSDFKPRPRRVTVLVWDICRNHFSKAWNVAEALSEHYQVQLVGFRFFDEPIFPPYAQAKPAFDTCFIDGSEFPDFAQAMGKALLAIDGDIIYCVKPRLPSFGLGLLAHYHFGTPLICESNDLESGVSRPGEQRALAAPPQPDDVDFATPYHDRWTAWLEDYLRQWPWKATHNSVHDTWLGGGSYRIMNLKDEAAFNPAEGLREQTRQRLGIGQNEFVLLFGGLVRRHKGIFELLDFVREHTTASRPLRLLVVGSRASPEYKELQRRADGCLSVIEPQDRNAMAAINAAADAVLLWLNPDTEASHHQMPFKMTDAFAMQVPVLASPVGDLAALGGQGVLTTVPFGNTVALRQAIDALRDNPEQRAEQIRLAREYYLRSFSYRAIREQFAAIERDIGFTRSTHPIAIDFARQFERYLSQTSNTE